MASERLGAHSLAWLQLALVAGVGPLTPRGQVARPARGNRCSVRARYGISQGEVYRSTGARTTEGLWGIPGRNRFIGSARSSLHLPCMLGSLPAWPRSPPRSPSLPPPPLRHALT